MPEVRKLRVVGKFNEGTVKSVNGALPDQNGNVVIEVPRGLPEGGSENQVLVKTADGAEWADLATTDDIISMLADLDALPAVADENGAILTDEHDAILLM